MRYLEKFSVFESKKESLTKTEQMIKDFKSEYGTILDPKLKLNQIKLLKKAFEKFDKRFIKNKIHAIILKDLGGVHGKWTEKPKKKYMTLNPSIFDLQHEFENGSMDIPYKIFVLVHEIAHCIDHIERVSYSKTWQAISGWKRLDRDKAVPEGYVRYIEKRKGREKAGPKKSNWIYKKGSNFCRKYSSRNPREDFADSFAFGVFGSWNKFKGEDGQKKMSIIKELLKRID